MNINALKDHVNNLLLICDEIRDLQPGKRMGYSLSDYIDLVYQKIINLDHGERDRFYVPSHDATMRLNILMELDNNKINSSFSTNKAKLLSCVNRYIKDMQRGFKAHDLENNNARY